MANRRASAVLGLLVSCSHTPSPQTALPDDASGPRGATPGAAGTPDNVTLSVVSGGSSRVVIVHALGAVPGPRPLVLNLHGSGATAAGQEALSGMDAVADARGFVVAYPQGAIALGTGFAWNVPGQPLLGGQPVPQDAPDDTLFVAAAITSIEQAYAIDAKRVFVTGMSGGARMASQIGCDLSTRVAAVAPVAGLRFPSPCAAERPVAVVAFHGNADTVNPYDGNGQPYWTYSVPTAATRWAASNGCNPSPVTSEPVPNVTMTLYAGCRGAADVALYTLDGAGHVWPDGPSAKPSAKPSAGDMSAAIDANAVMWAFFSAHARVSDAP